MEIPEVARPRRRYFPLVLFHTQLPMRMRLHVGEKDVLNARYFYSGDVIL